MVNYEELRSRNEKEAIIRCIELIGLKNPEIIEEKDDGVYTHTNTRGRVRCFRVAYGYSKYAKQDWKNESHKLHKVNGFYIGEFK